jgi:hypothetical protein
LEHDSPVVDSWCFFTWKVHVPPARTEHPRSSVVGAILMATRRPTDLHLVDLRSLSLLTHEVDEAEASELLHELDKVGAFDVRYRTLEEWARAIPAFWDKMAAADCMRLKPDLFREEGAYAARSNPPNELAFLHVITIADLSTSVSSFFSDLPSIALARAFLLAGSKDSKTERDDASSVLRIVAERIRAVLGRALGVSTPSDPGLAAAYATALSAYWLPAAFISIGVTPWAAVTELTVAYEYLHGNASEVRAIEQTRILRIGFTYPHLYSILKHFNDPFSAWIGFESLSAQLISASLASASTQVKLMQLDTVLSTAAWRAIVAHAINANANISGSDLLSVLIQSHTDLAPSSGSNAAAVVQQSALGSAAAVASYGSVRDTALGDALRLDEARDALDEIQTSQQVRVA